MRSIYIAALIIIFPLMIGCGTYYKYPGQTGPQGVSGTNGVTGPTGQASNCSVTEVSPSLPVPRGGALISCSDNSSTLVLNGTNGVDGQPGTAGTLVTPVQFCPGDSVYNSSYPEVGFCINDKLYAIYSSVSTLVVVPPGDYGSASAGNGCSFTVGNHCEVTN